MIPRNKPRFAFFRTKLHGKYFITWLLPSSTKSLRVKRQHSWRMVYQKLQVIYLLILPHHVLLYGFKIIISPDYSLQRPAITFKYRFMLRVYMYIRWVHDRQDHGIMLFREIRYSSNFGYLYRPAVNRFGSIGAHGNYNFWPHAFYKA